MMLRTGRVARLAAALLLAAASVSCQTMTFPDGAATTTTTTAENGTERGGNRNGKNLFGWLGTFADEDADPYLASANGACLQGDMTECFKARALSGLGDFFVRDSYRLNENVRVVRLSRDGDDDGGRSSRASYEFSTEPRPDDSEWDRLVKFAMRKVERFLRSAAVEVHVPDELTEGGRYSPRFIDEISSELDTLEDKKASIITKKKVKKLLVPLLIVLKLFKLKLLLFLPLILGLASFKKFLGFMALVVPGLIGFFKLCKPDLQHNYGTYGHSSFYNRPSAHHAAGGPVPLGSAYAPYRGEQVLQQEPHSSPYREHPDAQQYLFEPQDRPSFGHPYNSAVPAGDLLQQEPSNQQGFRSTSSSSSSSGSVSFKDDANDMAYKGYNGGSHK